MSDDGLDDDDVGFNRPLPPDDRIWRHPSEVGGIVHAARRRREISNGKLIGFAVAASLLGSVVTVGALAAGGAFDRTVVERSTGAVAETVVTVTAATDGTKWPEVAQKLKPSLARLETTGGTGPSTGSAVAFRDTDAGTYFVTSRDLVQNVERITLVVDGERRRRAELIGSDQYTNLAVVRLDGEHLDAAPFSTSEFPAGSDALVVGAAPPAAKSLAVAKALVGSVDNTQRARSGIEVQNLLRTDANITPDAKGGALVDASGSLIGLIVVMATDETGVERFGFALPTQAVQSTADSLIRTGFPTRVWLGISGGDLPMANAVELGLTGGALVKNVAVDSPAAKCGLRSGDVVIRLNTLAVDSMTRLVMALRELRPTDTVAIEYLRAGAGQRCFAALSQPPEAQPSALDGTSTTQAVPAGGSTVPAGGSTVSVLPVPADTTSQGGAAAGTSS